MNNTDNQYMDLIGDAYKNYISKASMSNDKDCLVRQKEGSYLKEMRLFTQEEFINKIKTDDEFTKKWGLKIEVRELSLRERMNLCREKLDDTDDGEILLPSDIEYRMNNYWGIPTRAISLTYNDKTIESYE
jgi:hypothetical protein